VASQRGVALGAPSQSQTAQAGKASQCGTEKAPDLAKSACHMAALKADIGA